MLSRSLFAPMCILCLWFFFLLIFIKMSLSFLPSFLWDPFIDNHLFQNRYVGLFNPSSFFVLFMFSFSFMFVLSITTTTTISISTTKTKQTTNPATITPQPNLEIAKSIQPNSHQTTTLIFLEWIHLPEPSAPPQEVRCFSSSSTSILVSWKPPPVEQQNGIITKYTIQYAATEGEGTTLQEVTEILPEKSRYLLENLEKWTEYRVTVTAHTDVGAGPESLPQLIRTEEDGMFCQNAVPFCYSFPLSPNRFSLLNPAFGRLLPKPPLNSRFLSFLLLFKSLKAILILWLNPLTWIICDASAHCTDILTVPQTFFGDFLNGSFFLLLK